MSLLLVFLDGVGLGEADPAPNPGAPAHPPTLRSLLGRPLAGAERVDLNGTLLIPTDATLGVAGLPQSATGQTALLTGLTAAGRTVTLANAYTEEYHEAVAARRLRHGAITTAALSAGVRLRTVEDLRRGDAVFHDLTNRRLRSWGDDLPLLTPFQAGGNLARPAATHAFVLFEFFLTDLVAHGRVDVDPVMIVEMVDEMLAGVIAAFPPEATLVVTSDHGNLEDGRPRPHTTNPVPPLGAGPARHHFRDVTAITDITPAVLRSVGVGS